MINRNLYLNQIIPFIDKPLIKVLAGIRRSGKSMLMMLLREHLIENGIPKERIIYINFESFEFQELSNAQKLYEFIREKISGTERYYILIDEIQEVESWEKVVNALLVDFNSDVYITGSNSRLLSSELATYIAGRYVEIHVQTLSFAEQLLFSPSGTRKLDDEFNKYLHLGGFPVLHIGEYDTESAYRIIHDIYSSAIMRDAVQRHNIRDIELLERVVRFVFDNIGSRISAKNIADYFKSQYRKVDLNTVYNYLNALESAFIFYRVPRYDIKGKEILKTLEKFYPGDHAILFGVMGFKDRLISGVLENIVMLELKRRGYNVFVGKIEDKEIDFVAVKNNQKIYVQVTYKMSEQSTIDREFGPLLDVNDQYPKYVVSMEETWRDTMEGVRHIHIADFLLLDEF